MGVPVSNKQTELVTLGSADIWINGIDVGHIKGDVAFACAREYAKFKPANEIGVTKCYRISEEFSLTCQAAELKLDNLKMALGVTTAISGSIVPTGYDASTSFTVTPATDKFDKLTFGGSKTIDDFPLKLEHTRPNGKKIILILYKAQCLSNLDLTFRETDFVLQTLQFQGLTDSTRSIGDRVGVMFDQVA